VNDDSPLRKDLLVLMEQLDLLKTKVQSMVDRIDAPKDIVTVPRQGPWDRDSFGILVAHIRHLAGIMALFSLCAEKPGETVYMSDILERSGLEAPEQRQQHMQYGKICKIVVGKNYWPVEAWQSGRRPETGVAEMAYRMDSTIAAWFREIS